MRVTLADGTRSKPVAMAGLRPCLDEPTDPPPGCSCTCCLAAVESAKRVSRRMREGRSVEQGTAETVSEWYARYFSWRAKRASGAETVQESRGRFRKWIAPKLGTRCMVDVTRDDLERFAAYLEQQVEKEVIASKTAVNLWGEVTVAFAFAHKGKNKHGKNLVLRVLAANPCDGAAGPEKGVTRQKTFLRPDEVTKLLACEDVPRERRLVYAVAIYTGMRQGELRALRVGDVDLAAMQITVARQMKNGVERLRTKTGRARLVQIEPNLLPLLSQLVANRAGTDRLLEVHAHNRCASSLRQDLLTAGCGREALHVAKSDPMRVRIKFHNLRDSCLTHMAVRRDPPQDIQWRAGHTTSAMTESYIVNAKYEAGSNFGVPLAALPDSLLAPGRSAMSTSTVPAVARDLAESSRQPGGWRARRRRRPAAPVATRSVEKGKGALLDHVREARAALAAGDTEAPERILGALMALLAGP